MSEQPKQPQLSEYYSRFWRRFRREIREAVWQAVIAILAIVAVVFLQFYYGWLNREQGVLSALQNIAPALAIALMYIAWRLIKTPWLLDADRQTAIDEVTERLTGLNAQLERMESELIRPKFTVKQPSLSAEDEFDEDDQHAFNFVLENIGSHPARETVSRIILAEEDPTKEPKTVDGSMANEIPINEPINMRLELRLSVHEPALYIVFGIRYKDAVSLRPYSQVFFLRWPGTMRGTLSQAVHHLTIDEREKVQARLRDYLTGFISEASELSQKVGSIPSSKMD